MLHFEIALRTTVLLVDDDSTQLELRALALELAGFVVRTASSPLGAISLLAQHAMDGIQVAVLDYDMPAMDGCLLADYLKARYPDLKIILHSGTTHVPKSRMSSIDGVIPKGDGVARLLEKVSLLARIRASELEPVISSEFFLSAPDWF
jgi:CheY-like chemotaxis protein